MIRKKLVHRLIRLRESGLVSAAFRLVSSASDLARAEHGRASAQEAARDLIGRGTELTDLGAFGEARLANEKSAIAARKNVNLAAVELGKAKRLLEGARKAGADIKKEENCKRELSQELDLEGYIGFSR
jgi:hypothetical protein